MYGCNAKKMQVTRSKPFIIKIQDHTPSQKIYTVFDPQLCIANTILQFMGDPFKFLGRQTFADMSEKEQQADLLDAYESYFETIDSLFN